MTSIIDPLSSSMSTAFSGMRAQATRLKIVSENLANAQTTGDRAGADPYRRQTVTFASHLDRQSGTELVDVQRVRTDNSPFRIRYEPGHPAADEQGFVKFPNVNSLIELADMRQANRGYEANLKVLTQARSMVLETIGLLRNS